MANEKGTSKAAKVKPKDYDDEPYGIRPAPGACCPDQPNCKHCREKVKPKCLRCGAPIETGLVAYCRACIPSPGVEVIE